MRIVVHGQQAFGAAVLDALVQRGEEVVGAYVAPARPGAKPDPMQTAAESAGIPVSQPSSFREASTADAFRALRPDLQVMAFVTLYVPESFLAIPTFGSIQFHPSILPRHRGPSSINWPVINGETETGVTIFWPDRGLDTGDILLQERVAIGPDETMGALYFDRLFPLGVRAMLEAVDLVRAGRAPRIRQEHDRATYAGWCTDASARIDWGKPVRQIHDLVRGCNPRPGAWATIGDRRVTVLETRPLPAIDPKGIGGEIGEIVDIDSDSVAIACADGRIQVLRIRTDDGQKPSGGTWARDIGLAVGQRSS